MGPNIPLPIYFLRSMYSPYRVWVETFLQYKYMKKNFVYFHKLKINAETKSVMIICSTAPLETKEATIAGKKFRIRSQNAVQFGILTLMDETGQAIKSDSPMVKDLKKLKQGEELAGFVLSDNPVMRKQEDGTQVPTGLFWVDHA